MANTNKLKKVIQPSIEKKILTQYSAKKTHINQIPIDGFKIKPDLIAISNETIIIAEITVSGYFGSSRGNYHAGGTKKIYEAFCKFFLIRKNFKDIMRYLKENCEIIDKIERIDCLFVVPQNARFIKGLGYQKKLFKYDIMKLVEIELDRVDEDILTETIRSCREEQFSGT